MVIIMKSIYEVDLNDLSASDLFYIKQAYETDFNIYYNKYKNNLSDKKTVDYLERIREDFVSNLKEKTFVNSDKFIIAVDDKLLGYCKYQINDDDIVVDTIYGIDEDTIRSIIKEISKKNKYHLDRAISNFDIDAILIDIAKTIEIDDFRKNPNLLNQLTKEQLIEVLKRLKEDQNNISINYMVDNSPSEYIPLDSISTVSNEETQGGRSDIKQKKISNGHSIIDDDKLKQGFVDALVMALLSGFISGVIATLLIIFIKMKTGL